MTTYSLTTGEKRSITISLKKVLDEHRNQTFQSESECFSVLYFEWVEKSKKEKVSWCFDKKAGWKSYEKEFWFHNEVEEKMFSLLKEYEIMIQPKEQPKQKRKIRSRIVAMSFCEPRSCIGRLSS